MRRLTLLAACGALTACTSAAPPPEPQIQVKTVEVPVAVKCAADPGPDPAYADTPDAIRTAADVFERVKLLLAGRAQRDARIAEVKASAAGCR